MWTTNPHLRPLPHSIPGYFYDGLSEHGFAPTIKSYIGAITLEENISSSCFKFEFDPLSIWNPHEALGPQSTIPTNPKT